MADGTAQRHHSLASERPMGDYLKSRAHKEKDGMFLPVCSLLWSIVPTMAVPTPFPSGKSLYPS